VRTSSRSCQGRRERKYRIWVRSTQPRRTGGNSSVVVDVIVVVVIRDLAVYR
jgi:hypothetical protein